MSNSKALVCLLFTAVIFSSLSFAVTPDRITGDLAGGPKVKITGNVFGLAQPEFDIGRADGTRTIQGVSLTFQPSAAQRKDLDQLLTELADRTSPNYHKYLTPRQFGERFGMSQNDIDKVVAWLKAEGFTNIAVSNSRNQISFDATVARIESLFSIEMHNYLVNGEVHLANSTNPSVPAALAGSILSVGHLHDFAPKPRVQVRPNLTSYVSGNHFLTPADFATIYDLGPLYSAGATGSTQKIAIVGQSTVSTTDLNNFRSAAGLPASTVTMTLSEGTSTQCSGDEGESDLDLEWSGGVAKSASIIFVYAGLGTGDSCARRVDSVWDALQYAVDHNVAPFISTSYGYCEPVLESQQNFPQTVQLWAQQGITQGQTIVSATGDAGAADCDPSNSAAATQGLAVDVPASIPEVTGAGGTEFTGDTAGTVTGNQAAGDPPYWSGSGAGSDTISSALEYIPEEGWNDTTLNLANGGGLSASGGGASVVFAKPTWQTGTGVPPDGKRDVPDISLSASADHDGYLVCSEDSGTGTPASTCTSGFRTGAGGTFVVVGGTSAVAPTFSAILALLNQYFGAAPGVGLAPINPTLYGFAATNPTVFHTIQTGSTSNNIVPCTQGTTGCPATAPFQYGFNITGPGYNQVTGLGSVDGFALAQVWGATIPSFSIAAGSFTPASVSAGGTASTTVTVTPLNGFNQTVTPACSGLPTGAACSFNPATVSGGSGTTQVTVQTVPDMAAANVAVGISGTSTSRLAQTTANLAVTATTESFSLKTNLSGGTLSVAQGQTSGAVNLTVTSTSNPSFIVSSGSGQQTALPVTYTCSGLPSESTCMFNGTANTITSSQTSVTLTIQTTAPTTRLQRPLDRGSRFFYAVLLPGLLGIVVTVSSRKRSLSGMRVLGLVMMLGFSTLWLASCGGTSSSSNKNPGTPTGSSTITVKAVTSGGGSAPITASPALTFTLTVTP